MSDTLTRDPYMRETHPYAVSVDQHDGSDPVYIHFTDKAGADFYASMFEPGSVRRFVAVNMSGHEGFAHPNGWREVAYFPLSAK